ncbi:MAG: hypothetical protein NE330_07775 [Lentisphaeraceae bacterium]|nr:hypothetical protein [Lentisphaeraceae bacterium]
MRKKYELKLSVRFNSLPEYYDDLIKFVKEYFPSYYRVVNNGREFVDGFSYLDEERVTLVNKLEKLKVPRLENTNDNLKEYYTIYNRTEYELSDFENADLFSPITDCDTGYGCRPEKYEDSWIYNKGHVKGFKYFTRVMGHGLIVTKEGRALIEEADIKGVNFLPFYEKDKRGKVTVSKKILLMVSVQPEYDTEFNFDVDDEGFQCYRRASRDILQLSDDYDMYTIANEDKYPDLYFSKKFYDFVNNSPLKEDLNQEGIANLGESLKQDKHVYKCSWRYCYLK